MSIHPRYYDLDVINQVRNILLAGKQTVAVAESATSGHLQVAFSLADNALQFFQGGLTAYNIGQKSRHLHIDPVHALSCNCVSEIVSGQMAKEVTSLFSSDWGIGVTGYAAVVPEKSIHNLFAYYSFNFRGTEITTHKIHVENNSPLEVQLFYTRYILSSFLEILKK
jgi:nicotinamide-nucleotide amidase